MAKSFLIFISSLAFTFCSANAELPAPYNSIQVLPANFHQNWYLNGAQLENLIRAHNVKTIIEVGSWLGASTIHMASILPADGKVYAVDHFLGSSEHQPGQVAWTPLVSVLYQQFLSNVIHAGQTQKIIPIKMDSEEAAIYLNSSTLKVVPDLIYIDASHETDFVYADLKRWFPYVKGRGILCGDDWVWGSVRDAVIPFAAENGLRIEANGNFWRLIE